MKLPLAGIRVLDMSRIVAAPLCAQNLGELGAEVIKVENPDGGDEVRTIVHQKLMADGRSVDGQSVDFLSVNRCKQSITINIKSPQGQALVRSLAAKSDILVENYKAGHLAKFGLDYASIRKVNGDIIYCSLTGFGQTGALANLPGFDSSFQAMSGMMVLTGDDERPQMVGAPIADYAAGQTATVAILAALWHRTMNGGGGQHIDVALLDCAIAALTVKAQSYLATGEEPKPAGAGLRTTALARMAHTRDGQITFNASRDADFSRLCNILGCDELPRNPRFISKEARFQHRAELDAIVDPLFADRGTSELVDAMRGAGIICGPVLSVGAALESDYARERELVGVAQRTDGIAVRYVRNPARFSQMSACQITAPPDLGADTADVLQDVLGLSAAAIADLRRSGAI